jgi:hypothetical protein
VQDHNLLLADIYTVYGAMHVELTAIDEATSCFTKAMRIREEAVTNGVLDREHPNRANSFMNLGVSVANQDTREAIRLHQKALDIRESSSKYTQDQVQSRSLNYLNRRFRKSGRVS